MIKITTITISGGAKAKFGTGFSQSRTSNKTDVILGDIVVYTITMSPSIDATGITIAKIYDTIPREIEVDYDAVTLDGIILISPNFTSGIDVTIVPRKDNVLVYTGTVVTPRIPES